MNFIELTKEEFDNFALKHPQKSYVQTSKMGELKEKQGNKVEQIINEFTDNENLKTAILEYIKMRKLIKSQMTERALKLALKKLKELIK